jgi:hypothetical protein
LIWCEFLKFFITGFTFRVYPRGKAPGYTYIFINKCQKYLKISGNTCKFREILGNIRKYYEMQDQKHELLENTLQFLRDSCSTWVVLLTGSWTILLFLLGYMKCQTENTMRNTRKYFAKNMKYQEILEHSR